MKIFDKLFKKQIDERQELELLKVERAAFWITFWLLFASIIVQEYIMGAPSAQTAGETVVLIVGGLVLTIGCVRKGLWSYHTKKVPGIKTYFIYSLVAGLVGVILGFFSTNRFEIDSIFNRVLIIAIISGSIFSLCFVTLLIAGSIAKFREKELEKKASEDEE